MYCWKPELLKDCSPWVLWLELKSLCTYLYMYFYKQTKTSLSRQLQTEYHKLDNDHFLPSTSYSIHYAPVILSFIVRFINLRMCFNHGYYLWNIFGSRLMVSLHWHLNVIWFIWVHIRRPDYCPLPSMKALNIQPIYADLLF